MTTERTNSRETAATPEADERWATEAARRSDQAITDKRGYGKHWGLSTRTIDNLMARGLPHLKIGPRRVRFITEEADRWMRERFSTQRRK